MKPYLAFLLTLFTTVLYSQESLSDYKSIEISNIDQTLISKIAELGIDLRCGAVFSDQNLELELNGYEINLLDSLNVAYNIKAEHNLNDYNQQISVDLENAKSELELLKSNAVEIEVFNEEITDLELNPILNYLECEEINWQIPQNFELGSMGGCLTVSETYSQLDLMRQLYPNLVSERLDASLTNQKTWGNNTGTSSQTWSPKSIYYVKITTNPDVNHTNRPQSLFTSMIHSREVSSLMSNMFFMWYLLENYENDPNIKQLLDNNEIYFIPIANPDGLLWNEVIAPNGGGMQRKNLRPNTNDNGTTNANNNNRGVDLNRNFDYFWGASYPGSSGFTSSQAYRGPSAFSEPETQILRDFVLSNNFKTVLMHHSFANNIVHPYGGQPNSASGREDEMARWHEDMTRYSRLISGAQVFPPANGIADDWMLGGQADLNNSVGSGMNILATTPEHGHGSEAASGFSGFWPTPSNIIEIAKRGMRTNLVSVYYAGKYANLHDLTPSNLDSIVSTISLGIDRIGQSSSDFQINIIPMSGNIDSIQQPEVLQNMSVLERRDVSVDIHLNEDIQPNEKVKYKVEISNSDTLFYSKMSEKIFQPSLLINDDPDATELNNWNTSTWVTTTNKSWTGTTSIKDGSSVPYPNNANRILFSDSDNLFDFSNSNSYIIEFYATWDLERNFDFVEIVGSPNSTNYTTLCGLYNKPKSTSLENDSHVNKSSNSHDHQNNVSFGNVYDADKKDNWIKERIIVDENNNSFLLGSDQVRIAFRLSSDANNVLENYSSQAEGFYLDDFKIIAVNDLSEPPTPVCKDIEVVLDENGVAIIEPEDIDNGSFDDIGIAEMSIDINSFDCSHVDEPVEVTLKVVDLDGQVRSCNSLVTVLPNETIVVDENQIMPINNLCEVNLIDLTPPTAITICGDVLTATTHQVFPILESQIIEWVFEFENTSLNVFQEVNILNENCSGGGIVIDESLQNFIIDFDSTFDGINNGEFEGLGVKIAPVQGQLNANSFSFLFNNSPSLNFGVDQLDTRLSNGVISAVHIPQASQAGVFALQKTNNNMALGFLPNGQTFVDGSVSFRVKNQTQNVINSAVLGFELNYLNFTNNTTWLQLSYGKNSLELTQSDLMDFQTAANSEQEPQWDKDFYALKLDNLNIEPGEHLILKWDISNDSQSGISDALALDDIKIIFDYQTTFLELEGKFNSIYADTDIVISDPLEIKKLLKLSDANIQTNEQLIFKSSEGSDAYLKTKGNASFTGDVTVERFIPPKRAFRFLGSSVTSTQSIFHNWQESGIDSLDYGTHITGNGGVINGFDETTTNNPSLFEFDSQSQDWIAMENTLQNYLNISNAYRLFVRGNRSTDLFNNNAEATATTLRYKGQINYQDVTLSNLNANPDAFNFVGNPFQAPLDMIAVLADLQGVKSEYLIYWDPSLNQRGAFVTYDHTLGMNTNPNSNFNNVLNVQQAVLFQNNDLGNSSVQISKDHLNYTSDNLQVFDEQPYLQVLLYKADSPLDAVIYKFNNASLENGISKLSNLDENIAIVENTSLLSIKNFSMPVDGFVSDLFMNNMKNGQYSFNFVKPNFDDYKVYLKDDYTNTLHEVNTTSNYYFNIDLTIPASNAFNRFSLVFEQIDFSNYIMDEVSSVTAYPNPVNNQTVNVNLPNLDLNEEIIKLEVVNLLGETFVIKKSDFEILDNTIMLRNLNFETGLYLLKIHIADKDFTTKLIINN